jgi:hypothetical protein
VLGPLLGVDVEPILVNRGCSCAEQVDWIRIFRDMLHCDFFQLISSTASIGCNAIRSHAAARVAVISVYHLEAPQNRARVALKMWCRDYTSESDSASNHAGLAKSVGVLDVIATADGNQSFGATLRRGLKG